LTKWKNPARAQLCASQAAKKPDTAGLLPAGHADLPAF
jgi:hypothetical protein